MPMQGKKWFWLSILPVLLFGGSLRAIAQGGISCAQAQDVGPGTHQTEGLTNGRGASRTDAVHARWFRFVAPQSGLLSVGSCGQTADTRLHLYRGSCGQLTSFAGSDDACDTDANPATPNAYAAKVEGLFVTANDTIYIEWDDHWDNNGFTWELAFQQQDADGRLLPAQRLMQVPLGNYPEGYPLRVLLGNRGQASLSDVLLRATVKDQVDQHVYTDSVLISQLSEGTPLEIMLGRFPLQAAHTYHITYTLSAEEDRFRENDTLRQTLIPSAGTFAVTNQRQGTLGGTARGSSWFGQAVRFDQAERLRGFSFSRSGGQRGDSLYLYIYSFDGVTVGDPDTVLGPWRLDTPEPKRQLLDFGPSGFTLSGAPNWLFALEHRARGQRLFVDYQQATVGQGEAWTKLGANAWQSVQTEGLNVDFTFQWHTVVPRTEYTIQLAMPDSLADSEPSVVIYQAGQSPRSYPLARTAAGNWQYVISLPTSDTLYYRFQRAGPDEEMVPLACSRPYNGSTDLRWATSNFSERVVLPLVCYGQCVACDQAPECSDPLALLCDPFEEYPLTAEVSSQADWWAAVRPGEDAVITDEEAYSLPHSLLLAEGGRKQTRLRLEMTPSNGIYQIQFRIFVPTGFSAGIALLPEVGITPLFRLLWGADISGRAYIAGNGYTLPNQLGFAYRPDHWENVQLLVDPARSRIRAFLNGQLLDEARLNERPFYLQLYSPNPTTRFFIDDVQIAQFSTCPETALICEAFEWYPQGISPSTQSVQWQFTPDEGVIDTAQAANGRQALLLEQGRQYTQAQLALGGWNKGRFSLEWQQFVPAGRSLGIQLRNATGNSWFQLIHNRNGERSGEAILGLFERVYNYPTSQWFSYRLVVDMNVRTIDLYLNEEPIVAGYRFREKNLDQLYFFLPNATGAGWVDAITFHRLPDLLTDVAFGVDLNRLPADQRSEAFIQGSFTNWEPVPMQSTNDGRFRYQARLPAGDTVAFRYTTGPDQLEPSETLTECGISDPQVGTNRLLIVGANSMNLGFPCFGFCSPCSNVTSITETGAVSSAVAVYPNPARNTVAIHWPGETIRRVHMVDARGAEVQSFFFAQADDQVQLPLHNRPPGLYYLYIFGTNRKQTHKLIVY